MKILDLLEKTIDNRGKTPPVTDDGYCLLEINCIAGKDKYPDYSLVKKHVTAETYNSWFRSGHPQKGDILIPTVGTLDAVSMMDRDDCCIAQNLVAFRSNPKICDCDFLYYLLCDPTVRTRVLQLDIGAVQPSIKVPHLKNLEVEIPDLDKQKKIARILNILDKKIAINKKVNENLLQQIDEIYRSWYVDFGYTASSTTCTDLGTIPNGWHYDYLENLCQSVSITHKFNKGNLIFLNTGDIENGQILHSEYMRVSDMPGQAKKTIRPNDILYSEIRPVNKHFAYVNFPSEDYVVSTKLMVIRSKGIDSRRLYHFLTMKETLSKLQLQAESRSGTFPQIRFDNVGKLPILIADSKTEEEFIAILHAVYSQIESNNAENKKLTLIRDTLLPKLMSGMLDVSNLDI